MILTTSSSPWLIDYTCRQSNIRGGRTRSRAQASSGALDAALTVLKRFICVGCRRDSGL